MGHIAKSTIKTSFVLVLRLLAQAATLLLVARMLGPELFGAFAGIAALAVLMGTFSTFGTHLVLLGEISKDRKSREHVLSYAVPTTIINGCILFLVYFFICTLGFDRLEIPSSVFFCIGLTEIVILPLFVLPATEQLALEKTARSQMLMVIPLAMRMLVAIGLSIMVPNQPLVMFSYCYILTGILALAFMKIYKSNAWLTLRQWRFANLKQIKYCSGYAILAVTAAGPNEMDKLMAVKILPVEMTGLYSAASRIIGASTLPVMALLFSALPRLFRYTEDKPLENRRLVKWIVAFVFIYGVIFSGFLWLASPLFEFLFGEKYSGISDMLKWLCFSVPGLCLRIALGNILISLNKPWLKAYSEVCWFVIICFCTFVFYGLIGFYSFILSVVLAEFLVSMVLLVFVICILRYKDKGVNAF